MEAPYEPPTVEDLALYMRVKETGQLVEVISLAGTTAGPDKDRAYYVRAVPDIEGVDMIAYWRDLEPPSVLEMLAIKARET